MNRPALHRCVALLSVAAFAFVISPDAQADQPPATAWIPSDAVLVAELTHTPELIDYLVTPELVQAVEQSPAVQAVKSKKQVRELLNAVQFLEAQLGTDWKTGLKQLTGGGITFAALPGGRAVLIVDTKDAEMLDKLHETLLFFARSEAEKQNDPDRVRSAEYRGVTGWSFGPNEAHALIGSRLVLANGPEVLREVIDLQGSDSPGGVATRDDFQAARAAAGGAPAFLFANMSAIKALPGVQKALDVSKEPFPVLLFSGVAESLRESEWLALGGDLHGDQATVTLHTGGGAPLSQTVAFAVPAESTQGALPNIDVPRRLAAVSLYRDLHDFYATKDELFPERTSGLIFFENMMGIFFSGRNLTEEVLAQTTPEVRMVAAEQVYAEEVGTPMVRLPAFATVFRMRNPDEFTPVVEEAWQKALGLINFTRGQQALPGLILDRVEYNGTKYTLAYFSAVDVEDKGNLDIRFNFSPTLVRVGEFMVMSSTEGLARDLIDALQREQESGVAPLANVDSNIELDGRQIASILKANWESLVAQNMLEKGHQRADAEREIKALVMIAELLREAELTVSHAAGNLQAILRVDLDRSALQRAVEQAGAPVALR